jgi:hypothetical protein
MKSGYGHYLNFQPDEYISIRGMLPIKPLAGKMRAPDAYFEGTFNYYLWAVPEMLHELWGGVRPIPMENMPSGKVKFILLSGRLMTVAFDLTALILLFAVIAEMTGQRLGALFGALLYGIFPIQCGRHLVVGEGTATSSLVAFCYYWSRCGIGRYD